MDSLRVTNILLLIIAVCLVTLTLSRTGFRLTQTAHAHQPAPPQNLAWFRVLLHGIREENNVVPVRVSPKGVLKVATHAWETNTFSGKEQGWGPMLRKGGYLLTETP